MYIQAFIRSFVCEIYSQLPLIFNCSACNNYQILLLEEIHLPLGLITWLIDHWVFLADFIFDFIKSISHRQTVDLNLHPLSPWHYKWNDYPCELQEAVTGRCSMKKAILKIFAKFIEKHLFKKGSNTVFSCDICRNFKSSYFEEHPWRTASRLAICPCSAAIERGNW